MALTSGQVADCAKAWAKECFEVDGKVATHELDGLKTAFQAIDDWCELNQNSFVLALPVAFRNNTTALEKSLALCITVLYRASRKRIG